MDLLTHLVTNFDKYADQKIIFNDQVLSYTELWEPAESLCRSLHGLGIARGDRIAVQLSKGLPFLYTYLASLQLGSIMVPLNNTYTREEMAYFIKDSGARLLIIDSELANPIREARSEFPSLEHLVVVGQGELLNKGKDEIDFLSLLDPSGPKPNYCPQPDDIALIIYTSGTTGRSKGAMLTQENIYSNLESLHQAWGHTDQDILLHTLPLFHIHGLLVAFHGALHAGMGIVMRSRFDPLDVLRCIEQHGCTIFMGVPTMYQRLLQVENPNRFNLKSMRLWISGSAPLPAAAFSRFQRIFGCSILERYGMSETGINVSNPLLGVRKPGSVGLPLPGVAVRVVDAAGKDVATGEVGEVWIQGKNVFKGYWQMPDKTRESFTDGWFRTGDLGYRDPEGYLYLVSRAKDLIISGGLNVYPKEIETLIETLEAVEEAAVIGVPDQDLGERVVAVVVTRPYRALGAEEVIALCRERLAGYKCPKAVFFAESLPKNAMGKVMKNVLREKYQLQ